MSFLEGLLQGVAEATHEKQKQGLQEEILKAQLGEINAKKKLRGLKMQVLMQDMTPEKFQSLLQGATAPEEEPVTNIQRAGEGVVKLAKGAGGFLSSLLGGSPAEAAEPVPPAAPSSLQQSMMGTPATSPTTSPAQPAMTKEDMLRMLTLAEGGKYTAPPLTTAQIAERAQAFTQAVNPASAGGGETSPTFGKQRLQGVTMDAKGNVSMSSTERAPTEWETTAQSLMGEGGLTANEAALVGQAYQRSPREAVALLRKMKPGSPLVPKLMDAIAEMNTAAVTQRRQESFATGAGGEAGRQSQQPPEPSGVVAYREEVVGDDGKVYTGHFDKFGKELLRTPATPKAPTRGQAPYVTKHDDAEGTDVQAFDKFSGQSLWKRELGKRALTNPKDRTTITDLKSSLKNLQVIGSRYDPKFTGGGGVTASARNVLGMMGKEEYDFRAPAAALADSIARLKEGGVIPEAMMKRFEEFLPYVGGTFRIVPDQKFQSNLTNLHRDTLQLLTQKLEDLDASGIDVSQLAADVPNLTSPPLTPEGKPAPLQEQGAPPAAEPAWERVQDPTTGKWIVRQKQGQ